MFGEPTIGYNALLLIVAIGAILCLVVFTWHAEELRNRMKENDVEQYLIERVEQAGGETRKVAWVGRRHAPDRLVMIPTLAKHTTDAQLPLWLTIWVEVKAPGKKPRPGQLREHERLRRMGQRVEIVDSFDAVDRLLQT